MSEWAWRGFAIAGMFAVLFIAINVVAFGVWCLIEWIRFWRNEWRTAREWREKQARK